MVKWGVCFWAAISHVTMSPASGLGVGVKMGCCTVTLICQIHAGACWGSALGLQNLGFLTLGVLVRLRWWAIFLCGSANTGSKPCKF